MAILKEAVEKRKSFLIRRLTEFGVHKLDDGRQLHEVRLSDLEHLYIKQTIQNAKREPINQIM